MHRRPNKRLPAPGKRILPGMALAVAAALALTACVSTPPRTVTPKPAATVDPAYRGVRNDALRIIRKLRQEDAFKGLSLALVKGNRIVWSEGFGYADVGKRLPASSDTVYRVGSIAKLITASAVMQLDGWGAIDIDQPLQRYLPQFDIQSRFDTGAGDITLRQILHHHSGLPSDLQKGMWSRTPFTRVAKQLKHEYTAFPPDLVFSYSNVGYTLLGHMVQEVSGTPFSEYARRNLLRPMGMDNSGFTLDRRMRARLAKGYMEDTETRPLPIRDLPAYALYSTASDLAHFMSTILAGGRYRGERVLPDGAVRQMLTVQNRHVALDLNVKTGLGFFIEDGSIPGAGRVVRHGGTTLLYSSEMILLPDKDLGIVVLSNSAGSRQLVAELAETILQLVLDPQHKQHRNLNVSVPAMAATHDLRHQAPPSAGGSYATDLGLITVQPQENKLCACIIGKIVDMVTFSDGSFGVSPESVDSLPPSYQVLGELKFTTRTIEGREVMTAVHTYSGKEVLLGERIPEHRVPAAWQRRTGTYRIINPDDGFPILEPTLEYRNGVLSMHYRIPKLSDSIIRVPLLPISDTEAVIVGLGRMRGETIRMVRLDGEEMLQYSGYLGQKVKPAPGQS
jgi:CubicO group peptidase (beta-lactamase class C family)